MEHSFDVDVAVRFGVNAAIIFKNLYHWVEKNRANEKNFHDGRYWTYNSVKAFHDLFPYLSEKQIRTAINTLIEGGAVVTGNYNSQPYDRTLWYSITDEWDGTLKSTLPSDQKDIYILPKGKMERDERENVFIQKGGPIPDSKPDKNSTDENTDGNECIAAGVPATATRPPKEPKIAFGEYGNVRLTQKEHERLIADYGASETADAIVFLDEYIEEKGYKSKSHNLAMRRWVFAAVAGKKPRKPGGSQKNPGGDYDWASL